MTARTNHVIPAEPAARRALSEWFERERNLLPNRRVSAAGAAGRTGPTSEVSGQGRKDCLGSGRPRP